MAVPEARRHDLYHGLEEVLGTDRADTLMAYLPATEAAALATRDDIVDLKTEIEDLRTEIRDVKTEFRAEFREVRTEFRTEVGSVNQRLDRLFLTMAAGLVAVVGAVITSLFVG